jgi:small subunit ribosomal protein S13
MAIISGVNIPDNKRVAVSLRSIHGIGAYQAGDVLERAGILDNPRVRDLDDQQLARIREIIDREKVVEGDLRREVNMNIRRLIDIGCYRGLRHRRGLPVRGQRTRTNGRTKRGRRQTVAGRRHSVSKK